MIVPNKTVVTYNGVVYGPGQWVPDPEDKVELTEKTIDKVIDKTWIDVPKKLKK